LQQHGVKAVTVIEARGVANCLDVLELAGLQAAGQYGAVQIFPGLRAGSQAVAISSTKAVLMTITL
jgi:hypothetical protein